MFKSFELNISPRHASWPISIHLQKHNRHEIMQWAYKQKVTNIIGVMGPPQTCR